MPGVSTGAEEHKLGIKGSSTCQLILEDVSVPAENVLGELGLGHHIAFNILNIGRLKLGAAALGGARECLEYAVKYASERKQFRTPLVEFGAVKRKIADMAVRIYVADAASYRTAGLIDAHIARIEPGAVDYDQQVIKAIEEYTIEQSIVKVFGTETLDCVADESLQMLGGYGFVAEYPLERHYRDSRINRIFEGTNEINRLLIPATMMKRVMTQGLPMLEFMQEVDADLASGNGHHLPVDHTLFHEVHAVNQAKRLVAYTTKLLMQREPAEIGRKQMHLERFADMIIDLYAMESAVVRTQKLIRRRGEDKAKLEQDMVAVFVADASERLRRERPHPLRQRHRRRRARHPPRDDRPLHRVRAEGSARRARPDRGADRRRRRHAGLVSRAGALPVPGGYSFSSCDGGRRETRTVEGIVGGSYGAGGGRQSLQTPSVRASAARIAVQPASVRSRKSAAARGISCVSTSSHPSSAGSMSIATCVGSGAPGTENAKTRRRGRSSSSHSPRCSTSVPSRRSVNTNRPPTRASTSARTIVPVGVAKRNRRARAGSRNASNTRSAEAVKRRTTRTIRKSGIRLR